MSMAGESGLWVDPAEIPSADDVERLGKALAAGRPGERDQLMANVAAYSGLRWGETTIYPRTTPAGYPLAERLAARVEQARTEQDSCINPHGLIFPSPRGKHWRSSNFNRNVLKRAYLEIGWRDADGNGGWTWHSLRHVFCTTALFTWKLDVTDVRLPKRTEAQSRKIEIKS